MNKTYLEQIVHQPEDDEGIENYAKGVVTGVMKSATPNVVAALLSRIRELQLQLAYQKEETRNAGRFRVPEFI
jgi:hypothetical protein